jgi:hypothetical protein
MRHNGKQRLRAKDYRELARLQAMTAVVTTTVAKATCAKAVEVELATTTNHPNRSSYCSSNVSTSHVYSGEITNLSI